MFIVYKYKNNKNLALHIWYFINANLLKKEKIY